MAVAAACVGLVDAKDAGLVAVERHRLALALQVGTRRGEVRERSTTFGTSMPLVQEPLSLPAREGGADTICLKIRRRCALRWDVDRTIPRAAGMDGGEDKEASIYISKRPDGSEWAAVRTINPDLQSLMTKRMGARTIELKSSHVSCDLTFLTRSAGSFWKRRTGADFTSSTFITASRSGPCAAPHAPAALWRQLEISIPQGE